MTRLWCLALILIGVCAHAETRRFAIVLGNNAGSEAMPPLRFAETDAAKMARVLAELGDVRGEDLFLLQGRGVLEVEEAVRAVRLRVDEFHRAPDTRAVVLFYYSGHSDGEALELGRERLSYQTLKAMLAGTGAELKVAIIDACKSGAAVREKGGRPAPGFTIRLADQLSARGEVFITSSAADEVSLESSEVMGSYFTHNLVSGLRGAADTSGDRQVTLAELYRFAYDRTVSATAMTPNGAQHPAYDYKLSGQGELVLSSLIRGSSTLELPHGAERSVVTDLARDQVVAEVTQGGARQIALEPGVYGVKVLRAGQAFGGRFRIEKGTRYAVRWEDLDRLVAPVVAMKGGGSVQPAQAVAALPPSGGGPGAVATPVAGGRPPHALPPPSRPSRTGPTFGLSLGGAPSVTENGGLQGALRLSLEPSPKTGFSFAVLGVSGSGLTSTVSETALQLRVGYRAAIRSERLFFSVGAEGGMAHLWISDADGDRTQLGWMAGPRAAFRVRVGGPAWLGVEGELPFTLVQEPTGVRAALTPSIVLGMALEL